MISKVNIIEFSNSLKSNRKYGNPKIMGTPFAVFSIFGESDKVFFGTYNRTTFSIAKNAPFFSTPFIMSGKINSKKNKQTEIIYEIETIGFGYYWLKYLPIFGILLFNLLLYMESEP